MGSTFSQAPLPFPIPSSRPARLCLLPREICRMIFECPILDHRDIKAARLACKAFDDVCASILFRRIVLSCVTSDRGSFNAISKRPHLAKHVRELVWYQLERDISKVMFSHLYDPHYWNRAFNIARDDVTHLVPRLQADSSNMFWLPSPHIYAVGAAGVPPEVPSITALTKFWPKFKKALDSMPNLRCLASEPMPPNRLLTMDGYPITASLVSVQCDHDLSAINDGLFMLLFQAMNADDSKIEEFRWIDHNIFDTLSVIPDAWCDPWTMLFHHITSIDMCLTWVPSGTFTEFNYGDDSRRLTMEFRNMLHSALALKRLRLYHEHTWGGSSTFDETDVDLDLLFSGADKLSDNNSKSSQNKKQQEQDPFCIPWPELQSLTLDRPNKLRTLDVFVYEHAKTLHHLHLQHCWITVGLVKKLAGIPGLVFHCVDFKDKYAYYVVPEDTMLQYLNKQISQLPLEEPENTENPDFPDMGLDDLFISTCQNSLCSLGLNFDTRDPDTSEDSYHEFDMDTGESLYESSGETSEEEGEDEDLDLDFYVRPDENSDDSYIDLDISLVDDEDDHRAESPN